ADVGGTGLPGEVEHQARPAAARGQVDGEGGPAVRLAPGEEERAVRTADAPLGALRVADARRGRAGAVRGQLTQSGRRRPGTLTPRSMRRSPCQRPSPRMELVRSPFSPASGRRETEGCPRSLPAPRARVG